MLRENRAYGATLLCFAMIFCAFVANADDSQHKSLLRYLTNLSGWDAKPAEGFSDGSGINRIIQAHRIYTQGDKLIHAKLLVANTEVPHPRIGTMDYMYLTKDTPLGEKKAKLERTAKGGAKISLFPLSNSAGVIRIILAQTSQRSAGFIFEYFNLNENEALSLTNKFNWSGIKQAMAGML